MRVAEKGIFGIPVKRKRRPGAPASWARPIQGADIRRIGTIWFKTSCPILIAPVGGAHLPLSRLDLWAIQRHQVGSR